MKSSDYSPAYPVQSYPVQSYPVQGRTVRSRLVRAVRLAVCIFFAGVGVGGTALADETCMSPFMPKITGQEDYV